MCLRKVNPYVLPVHKVKQDEYDEAATIVQEIVEDPTEDRVHIEAAFDLWGNALYEQKKYDEAIAKYQKAIELDPKDAFSFLSGDRSAPRCRRLSAPFRGRKVGPDPEHREQHSLPIW